MKFINKIFENKFLIGLGAMVFLVLAVRLWSFGDLLTFKMDQARDIKLIEEAYDGGIGELPLLGPRAAKTYLRLGPIFYYFEYLAMLIFGDQPWLVAVPDLIFSILTIPLFYYFLRQAFNKKVSFLTTVVFASSFFLNQYGRFAWNPNSIPFWSLLYFLGLYKLVHGSPLRHPTSPKLRGTRGFVGQAQFTVHGDGKWLLVAVVGYGVASQLHFTAMLAYPLIGVLFVLAVAFWESQKENGLKEEKGVSKNKKILSIDYLTIQGLGKFVWRLWRGIGWKYWLGAVAILGVMYLPMVLSEVYTHGDNWVQFKYALSGRGKPEFPLSAKIIQSVKLHSEYFWFSLTSWSNGAGMIGLVGFLGIVVGVMFNVWKKFQDTRGKQIPRYKMQDTNKSQNTRYKGQTNNKVQMTNDRGGMTNDKLQMTNDEEEMTNDKLQMTNGGGENRMVWFGLVFVWWVVMGLLYTKLAFNVLKPRYWLLEAPIFFVVLAVFLEGLIRNRKESIEIKAVGLKGNSKFKIPSPRLIRLGRKNLKLFVGCLVVIILVGMNLWATGNWYWELKNQKDSPLFLWHLKLKDQNKIPWGQLNKVVNYIEGDVLALAKKENKDVCFYTTGEYRPVYDYIFERRGISNKNFLENEAKNISVVRRISFSKDSSDNCLFIAIDHHQHREIPRIPKDHKDEFEKVEKKEVGFVTVWQVRKRIQDTKNKVQINDKSQMTNDKKMTNDKSQMTNDSEEMTNDKLQITNDGGQTNSKIQDTRYKQIPRYKTQDTNKFQDTNDKERANDELQITNDSGEMTNDKSQMTKEKIKKPRRVERVRWKDILPLRKYK